jgi:hypothetical protein
VEWRCEEKPGVLDSFQVAGLSVEAACPGVEAGQVGEQKVSGPEVSTGRRGVRLQAEVPVRTSRKTTGKTMTADKQPQLALAA